MNANRRLQERKQPELIVLCKLGGEESSLVLNLSEDGLCFESLNPIEETGLLQLRLLVNLNSAIETTGRLAWIDSAKRTGGLRFVELSAPARHQIRAWLSQTSAASSAINRRAFLQKRDKQADDRAAPVRPAPDKPVIWQGTHLPSVQLVSKERYRAQMRRQFFLGVLIGFGIGTVVIIPMFRYAGITKPGSLARTTASANRAAQSSAQQTQASPVQPASPNASTSEPAAVQTVSVAAPRRSPQRKNPQTSAASSTDLMTGTLSPAATPQPAKRVTNSRPSTKAEPLGATQAAVRPAASNAHFSSQHVQYAKKVPPTPQQLWSALQAGNMKAAVALADLFARGEGVPVDCQQARVLLIVASAKGNAEASKKLQELDKGGCPQTTTASEPKP